MTILAIAVSLIALLAVLSGIGAKPEKQPVTVRAPRAGKHPLSRR